MAKKAASPAKASKPYSAKTPKKSILQRAKENDPSLPDPPAAAKDMLTQMKEQAELGGRIAAGIGQQVVPSTKADIERLERKLDELLHMMHELRGDE